MKKQFTARMMMVLGVLIAALFATALPRPVLAAANIWESYIILNGTYHDVKATTGNPNFPDTHLGTFMPGTVPFTLSGGEVKTWKDGATDITSARLNYRVFPTSTLGGSFIPVDLPFAQDLGSGNQKWATTAASIDLLSGLTPGNYTLEIYYDATTNGNGEAPTIYDSNGGFNYAATFTVVPVPIYVDATRSTDTGDGTSWATAKKYLQSALALANPGPFETVEIWVANGTYYPDEGTGQTDNARGSTFSLKNHVVIYGGFAGNETLLSQRNPVANEAILSGDLLKNDTPSFGNYDDNAYHVVSSDGNTYTAILDGFTILGGFAESVDFLNSIGGGIYTFNYSEAQFANLIVHSNHAVYGGGMYNRYSSPNYNNVTISGNRASGTGGGVNNFESSPIFTTVLISGNHTSGSGGGVYNDRGFPRFINATISGNWAPSGSVGGVYNNASNATFVNSIIWANTSTQADGPATYEYSLVQDLNPDGNNLDGTNYANAPRFVAPEATNYAPTTDGNYRLQVGSPVIDASNQVDCPATDRDGLPRTNDGSGNNTPYCDLGAYEAGQMLCGVVPNETYSFGTNGGVRIETTATTNNLACLYVDQMNRDHPNATAGIKTGRYWAIHGLVSDKQAAATGFSVNLTLPAPFTPTANDKLCRYTGNGWDCAMSSNDTVNKTITRNGISGFSDWAVGDNVSPTAITLLDFTATRETTGVRLTWATGSELNTAGFRLERSRTDDPADATPLEAAGFIAGEGDLIGAEYTHLDTEAVSAEVSFYWLIEAERDGRETRYGPVRVDAGVQQHMHRVFIPVILR